MKARKKREREREPRVDSDGFRYRPIKCRRGGIFTDVAWWYEDRRGISVHGETRSGEVASGFVKATDVLRVAKLIERARRKRAKRAAS